MNRKPQRCSRKKGGKNWRGFGQKSMRGLMSAGEVPLEGEFIDWLYHKKLLTHRTIRRHIATLRHSLASRDLRTYLLATLTDSRERTTQRYYKEFLAEHFSHITLPLLQDEMRSERASKNRKT